ncbi:MAG: nitrile hydratase accessory protein [Pseudomonadota bacterium]
MTADEPKARFFEGLPTHEGEPVFAEPWQAQAFALTVSLYERGTFTWSEWAEALSHQIKKAPESSGADYFHYWLAALETLMTEKGLTTQDAIKTREQQWHEAAARTPHGEPIEL